MSVSVGAFSPKSLLITAVNWFSVSKIEKSNSGKKLQGNTIRPYRFITNGLSNITSSFARRSLFEFNQDLVNFDCFPGNYLDAFHLPRKRSRDAGFHLHGFQNEDQIIR